MALQAIGFFGVPSCYIMRRWIKDIRSEHHKRNRNKDVCSNKEGYDLLYKKVIELLEEKSLSNESCQIAHHALEETLKWFASINWSLKSDKENIENNILLEKMRKRTYNGRLKKV